MVEADVRPAEASLDREAAFAALSQRHLDTSYRLATLILGDANEAEDATHDALVLAWRRWETLRDPERFEGWLHRILVNVCRNRLRGRRGVIPLSEGAEQPVRDDGPGAEERDALRSALAALSPEHRAVVALRFHLDLPLDEIAARLDAPVGTVKSRLHYALRQLRAAYDAASRESEDHR